MNRRQKCDKCRGSGGRYVNRGRTAWLDVWLACTQCRGLGTWWPNNRPKPAKS